MAIHMHLSPYRFGCRCAVAAIALAMLVSPAVRAQQPSDGVFVSVHNPITSEVTSRVKEITNRAVERFREAERAAGGKERGRLCGFARQSRGGRRLDGCRCARY